MGGREKMVLGLIFSIIVKYMTFDDEDISENSDIKVRQLTVVW